MKIIKDAHRIQELLHKKGVLQYFDTSNLSFSIHEYEKGEFLIVPEKVIDNFLFVVEGNIQIYGIRLNGGKAAMALAGEQTILGDLEFTIHSNPAFFAEATSKVICLALPMEKYRKDLSKDAKFLKTLLHSVSTKMASYSRVDMEFPTVEEKVLFYMQNVYENHELIGIESSIIQLRCSRRQLQRVLKKLCDDHVIIQFGKGKYRLNG